MASASVVYKGRSDARVLAAADLTKAGVEGFTKTVFQRNKPTEVDSAVAKALIENTALFGKFETVEKTASVEKIEDAPQKSSK